MAGVPDAFCVAGGRGAFCFAIDPPDRPTESEEEGADGAESGDGVGEAVGEKEEGEVVEELPAGKVAGAEDGVAGEGGEFRL